MCDLQLISDLSESWDPHLSAKGTTDIIFLIALILKLEKIAIKDLEFFSACRKYYMLNTLIILTVIYDLRKLIFSCHCIDG